jgi:hypothetical protein
VVLDARKLYATSVAREPVTIRLHATGTAWYDEGHEERGSG